jgi:hypothetical protein
MVTKRDREIYNDMDSLDENVQDTSMDVHTFFELLREEIRGRSKKQNGQDRSASI